MHDGKKLPFRVFLLPVLPSLGWGPVYSQHDAMVRNNRKDSCYVAWWVLILWNDPARYGGLWRSYLQCAMPSLGGVFGPQSRLSVEYQPSRSVKV